MIANSGCHIYKLKNPKKTHWYSSKNRSLLRDHKISHCKYVFKNSKGGEEHKQFKLFTNKY